MCPVLVSFATKHFTGTSNNFLPFYIALKFDWIIIYVPINAVHSKVLECKKKNYSDNDVHEYVLNVCVCVWMRVCTCVGL